MKIAELEIKNFRSVKAAKTPLTRLAVLVGRNGSGKSSILQAINILFTLNSKITEEDFFNKNIDEPIEIVAVFDDLTDEEKTAFQAHVDGDKMVVLKKISWNKESSRSEEKYFSFEKQIPQFAKIREIQGGRNKTEALKELKVTFPDLETPKSEAQTLEIMKEYEKKNTTMLQRIQVEVSFFGAKNVGGGKLDNFTRSIFLPAVKEASRETEGQNSSISRLLDTVVLHEIENRQDLLSFREEITKKISEKFSPENLGGLESVSKAISETLDRYSPGSRLQLGWNEVTPPEISLPTVTTTVFEDNFGGDISKKGHGLQRALILTLLEHLALTLATTQNSSNKEKPETPETNDNKKPLRIDTILLIEEPEIYLHPSRAKYLSKLLLDLSSSGLHNEGWASRAQVIYTTHSPYFVGLDRFDNLRLCRKIKRNGEIPFTEIVWNDLTSAESRYETICGRTTNTSNCPESFKIKSANVMNTEINEGFFADLVVLVEGPSDLGVLWKVQEKLSKNWDKYSISVIAAENKENIIRIKIVFDGLKIPSYVVFDKDEQATRSNQRLLSLLGVTTGLPAEKVQDTWAYNDEKLEDELKRDLSVPVYDDIWSQITGELDCRYDRICKNIEANAWFTDIAYGRGFRLSHSERIVEKIALLHSRS